MKHKKKRPSRLKPSMFALQSELRKMMVTNPEEVERRLDELALTDAVSACIIGETLGIFEPEEEIELAPGVYGSANLYIPPACW